MGGNMKYATADWIDVETFGGDKGIYVTELIKVQCNSCSHRLKRAELTYTYYYYCGNPECRMAGWDIEHNYPELSTSCCKDYQPIWFRLRQSNDTIAIRKGCKKCLKVDGKSYKKTDHPDHSSYPIITTRQRDDKYQEIRSEENLIRNFYRPNLIETDSNTWWEDYSKYLDSEEWKDIREKVLERDNYTCQGCLDAAAEQVHHKTYDHYKKGFEIMFDLTSVCKKCHGLIHGKRNGE